jgi:uncharacterized protein YhhL (DUF1145 family)
VILKQLNHPFARHLHELVEVGSTFSLVLAHQLIFSLVCAKSHLSASQDLAVQVVIAIVLHHQLELFKQGLSLGSA